MGGVTDNPLSGRVRDIVESISIPAVGTDLHLGVIAANEHFSDVVEFGSATMVGRNLIDLIQARDIFGNRLSREVEGLQVMAENFDRVKDFKISLTTGAGKTLFVGISVIIVMDSAGGDSNLILLVTPIERRRRSDQLLDQVLVGVNSGNDKPFAGIRARGMADAFPLTGRQKEVLRLLAEGNTPREISDILCLSIHTVRSHIQKILRQLEVSSQLEAVTKALTLRIL